MIKHLYNSIKSYFSNQKNANYQLQNSEWFTPEHLENFKTKPKLKDPLASYFEWAEGFVK
jgi:hypothetical protein